MIHASKIVAAFFRIVVYEIPDYGGKKVTFMFLLLTVTDLISIVKSNASPDQITVDNLNIFAQKMNKIFWMQNPSISPTSQSSSVNMFPDVLISSMIASNSSS